MSERFDAVIIGAGHNGLVCAYYLARTGLKVCVLERLGVVGGAAVTEEFHPGFRNSVASYTVGLLEQRIMDDMKLADRGSSPLQRQRGPATNSAPPGAQAADQRIRSGRNPRTERPQGVGGRNTGE